MEKFRLIALDIDGTLVNDEKRVPEANREALQRAVSAGFHVAIASGRMTPRIEPVAEQIGIDPVIIAYNGGKVVAPHSEGRRTLYHKPLSAEVAEKLIQFSREEGLLLNFYHEDRVFAEDGPRRRPFMDIYHRRTGAEYEVVSDLTQFFGITPTKLILLTETAERDRLCDHFREELAGQAFVTKSDPEYLEIMADGVDKGRSLSTLGEHYGLSTDEMIGVGDANNDLELVRSAGLGIAVANATDDLKAVADEVAEKSNNEAAVADIVERWLLS